MRKLGIKRMFALSFAVLVVLPILIILVVAAGLLRSQFEKEAHERVNAVHESITSSLRGDIREASLSISRLLFANDDQVLKLVSTPAETASERYETTQALGDIYRYAFYPIHNVEAIHFYLDDGTWLDLEANLAVDVESVKAQGWYDAARQKSGKVHIGFVEGDILLTSKRNPGGTLLVAALASPDERTNTLELACLYFEISADKLIDSYNVDMEACDTFLLDENGDVLLGAAPSGPGGTQVTTQIQGTGWTLVTQVDEALLFAGYDRAMKMILLLAVVVFALYTVFSVLFLQQIIHPIKALQQGMQEVQQGNLGHRLERQGHREIQDLAEAYNDMAARIGGLLEENQRREQEKYAEELKSLQNEINPHFLLNTVNTIRFMADIAGFEGICEMSQALMEILNCTLRLPGDRYTLADELKILKSYATIMQVRYNNSFRVDFDLPKHLQGVRVPKLLLQPLVENSILHGFADMQGEGVIEIGAACENGALQLTVRDNGKGMPAEGALPQSREGRGEGRYSIGLANVRRRLQLHYGTNALLAIQSVPGAYTCVTLTLPVGEEQNDAV